MHLYDTLSKTKKELKKPKQGRALRLFVCGPTVYDLSHIGHARTYLAFDMFVNYLRYLGYKVFYIQNITDIAEKIKDRAKEKNSNEKELALSFEKEYLHDMRALGIYSVDKYARASNYIKEIIKQIQKLEKNGYAYKTERGVYYRIKKFKNYGKLSGQSTDELKDSEHDSQKENPADFALWKITLSPSAGGEGQTEKSEQNWPSPWGKGRPGWHIEDTALTHKEFKSPQYELHGGARDLIFPHHEAEIAQMEAAYGKSPMVEFWMHTGFLNIGGQKMSKSLKNFITIRDILKKYSPQTLRLFFTTKHYRSPIDYNEKSLEEAKSLMLRIANFWTDVLYGKEGDLQNKHAKKEEKDIAGFIKNFWDHLADDFNTPAAFGEFFKLLNYFYELKDLAPKPRDLILGFLQDINKIFNIVDEANITKPENIPTKIMNLVLKREKLRDEKDFSGADELRRMVEQHGYVIEDRNDGPVVKKKI